MTQYNKATLKTYFAQGDTPSGSDFANLIDSYMNQVETATQQMAGPIQTTKVIAPVVSANTVFAKDEINTALISAVDMNLTGDISVFGITASASTFGTVTVSSLYNSGGATFAKDATIAGNANLNTVNIASGPLYLGNTVISSAAGTSQGTAAALTSALCIRLQGATDGSATGYRLLRYQGMQQLVFNENAVSANLWPDTGCAINGLSTNAAFGMVAKTPYIVFQYAASAYFVK